MFSFDRDQIRFFLDIAQDDAYELWKVVVVKYECKTVASKADYLNVLYEQDGEACDHIRDCQDSIKKKGSVRVRTSIQ